MGKIIGKNIIGGSAADNGSVKDDEEHIREIESKAIMFFQTIASQKSPLCLAYSGGKDSEVLLHIAQKSGIEFTAFYNKTTNDLPGTIKYIKSKPYVQIIPPKRSFFTLIEHRGMPSAWQRFCCSKLKERYIGPYVFTGVRAAESTKRKNRYKEPSMCMTYNGKKKGEVYMPLLYWSDKDIEAYIKLENIRCHPVYYDDDGHFNIKKRLGCMACPLRNDRGREHFLRYPKLVRAWCRALAIYRNTRPTITKSISHFIDEYENFYTNVMLHTFKELESKRNQKGGFDPRKELMEYFHVDLPPAQSSLKSIRERLAHQQKYNSVSNR